MTADDSLHITADDSFPITADDSLHYIRQEKVNQTVRNSVLGLVLSCVLAAKNKMGKIQYCIAHNVWCSGVINHSKGSYSGEGIHHLDRFSSTGETTLLGDKTYYWTDLSLQYHNTPIRSHTKYIIIKEIWFLAVIDQLSDTFWGMWAHATWMLCTSLVCSSVCWN